LTQRYQQLLLKIKNPLLSSHERELLLQEMHYWQTEHPQALEREASNAKISGQRSPKHAEAVKLHKSKS
jgi:hypothetical protein